ncbi:MAG TPA: FliH/SctL family protein [Bryobacterales bacterium]|nr:FliH/SctL family protein [Bryobacterales bacterium]
MPSSVVKRDAARSLPPVDWPVWTAGGGVAAVPAGRGGAGRVGPPAAGAAELARVEKEAYERGFREGEAAGARQGVEQFQGAMRAFAQSAAALAGHKPALRAEAEREAVMLSLAVAQRIVRRELAMDPTIVLAVVKACFEELGNAEIYRLRLHPQDVQPVAAYLHEQRGARIELIADAAIGRGGAVFETSQGRLDARVDTQLAEIERGLADR